MFLANVIGIALFIIGLLLSLQGLWLLCRALWPNRVRKTADRCQHGRIAALLLGVPITVVVLGIAGAISRRGGGPGHIVGGIIFTSFLVYASTGMSGFVTFVGERLASPGDALRPWWTTVRGGAAVELAALFPVIGWLILLPVLIMVGVGAITLSFFDNSPRSDLRSMLEANRPSAWPNRVEELPALEPQESA